MLRRGIQINKKMFHLSFLNYCKNNEDNGKNIQKKTVNGLPEPPTNCCMKGCPNCVWLDYADDLTKYFDDGGKNAAQEIETHVTDPSIKAYLMHELRMRKK